jgi:hypothetical protein
MALVDYVNALFAPFARRHGNDPDAGDQKYGYDNNFTRKWRNFADDADVEVLKVGRLDFVQLAGAGKQPSYALKSLNIEPNAKIVDQVFFIADRDYVVKGIRQTHKTAGSVTASAIVRKCADGVTIPNGTALCDSLDLTDTKDTTVEATLSTTASDLVLKENDRIAVDISGDTTTLAGLTITLVLSPGHTTETAVFSVVANGDLADRIFFVAPRPMLIKSIKECHNVLGTNGSAVTASIKKQDSTETASQGDVLLSSVFSLKTTINTVQEGALVTTAGYTRMAAGDRLSVDFAGTLTAVAGLCIMVEFEPLEDVKLVTFMSPVDGASVLDQSFFIADRDYQVMLSMAVWMVASGGATNFQLTADPGTVVPGAGVDLLSNDSAAGFQTDGTPYVPEEGAYVSDGIRYVKKGERLSMDANGTLTTMEGIVVTVALKPC